MAIKKFTWNNGTERNPVPLTTTQMNKLISAGNNRSIETSVAGYYKEANNRSVVKSIVWSLERLFPDLHFKGVTANDSFSISTRFTQVKEGSSIGIVASGINVEYLKFACVFETIDINGEHKSLIDEATIKSRFRFSNGNLIVDAPKENATWSAILRIKACPIYEDINTTTNYRLTGQNAEGEMESAQAGLIVCDAKAMTGVRISSANEMSAGSLTYINKSPLPADSTKLSQATYSYAVSPATAGNFTGDYFRAGSVSGDVQITATPRLFGDTLPVSNILTISVYESRATTIRINQNISDPITMVLNPKDCGAENLENNNNIIAWIRKNSHCYLGKFYGEVDGMKIKQLYDRDRRYYDNNGEKGELAPIDGTPDEDGIIGDVFMKMPEFYYKTVNETNDSGQETGIVAISFATGRLDDSYIRWNPNTLIGVYKGTIINDGTYDKLYSISGVKPVYRKSQSYFKESARRRNDITALTESNYFSIVDYQTHVVMALLYYCYYGGRNINCQAIVGAGTEEVGKTTGSTDTRAMSDTSAIYDGNSGSINFWGLENWWGDTTEYIDNLATTNANGLVNVLSYNGTVTRQVQVPFTDSKDAQAAVSKFIFGEYADLLPASPQYVSMTLNFCDGAGVKNVANMVGERSYFGNSSRGGVGFIALALAPTINSQYTGARLLYQGKITEVS